MGKPEGKAPKNRQTKLYLTFNDDERTEYLTGFHKRKVERKKKAKEELVQQMKEEQKRLKDERRQQFMDLLRERRKAQGIVNDLDELDKVTTSKTESIQIDHPNHTVTVTTISDLDLCHPEGLKLGTNTFAESDDDEQKEVEGENEEREGEKVKDIPLPNKKQCLTSKRLSSLMSSLNPKKNKSGKRWKRGAPNASKKGKRPPQKGKTTKTQRRQRTGGREKKGGFSG